MYRDLVITLMIIEGWIVDLYCDHVELPNGKQCAERLLQIYGITKGEAWRQIRQYRWRKKGALVYCPQHAKGKP